MTTLDATALVMEHIEAYNARHLDRTVSYYASDARIFGGDGALLDDGREAIRAACGRVFAVNPELHADIPAVVQVGPWVMVHSIVPNWAMADGSRDEMQWIELYQVVDGKIQRVQLFR